MPVKPGKLKPYGNATEETLALGPATQPRAEQLRGALYHVPGTVGAKPKPVVKPGTVTPPITPPVPPKPKPKPKHINSSGGGDGTNPAGGGNPQGFNNPHNGGRRRGGG